MKRRDFSKLMVGAASVGSVLSLGSNARGAQAAVGAGSNLAPVERAHRKEWAREHFRGFENVLVASFTPDRKSIDEAGIRLDVRKSIEHGFFSSLISPAGLSHEEFKQVMGICVDEAHGKIAIGYAVDPGEHSEVLDLVQHGEKVGCQHILLDVPREGSADELYNYVAAISETTNMGIYLWMAQIHGFQRFGPSGIPYEFFDRASKLPNIIALKVGNMDPAVLFELFNRYNDTMLIGALWPNIMPMGIQRYGQQWSGAWTVEALQSPEQPYAAEFFKLMLAGKYDEGMKLYWRYVVPGFGAMMKLMGKYMASGAHPWELIKFYQFAVGGNGGPMRVDKAFPDIPPVTEEDMNFVRGVYAKLGIGTTKLPNEAFRVGAVNWEQGLRPQTN